MHTPAFASYDGPVRQVGQAARVRQGGRAGDHDDAARRHAPRRARALLLAAASSSATCRSSGWSARRASSTSSGWASATTTSTGPSTSSAGSATPGITIERDDILIIHTGYHRYYPENWADRSEVDETKLLHPPPGPDARVRRVGARARGALARGRRRQRRPPDEHGHPPACAPDEAEDAEEKLGRPLDEIFPKRDYQIMHTLLFPHDVIHIENLGGEIDEVLDQRSSSAASRGDSRAARRPSAGPWPFWTRDLPDLFRPLSLNCVSGRVCIRSRRVESHGECQTAVWTPRTDGGDSEGDPRVRSVPRAEGAGPTAAASGPPLAAAGLALPRGGRAVLE